MKDASMIRVLYIADSLMAGGIESQLVALTTGLDRARIEPHIVCLYGPTARALHYAPMLQAAGLPYTSLDLGWSARDKVGGVHGIISSVRHFTPDLIQAEGYHANLLLRMAAPFLPRHVPLIGTVRGALSRKQILYERLSGHFCACLVVNAPHLKTMLVTQAGIAPYKVRVILNGMDTARFGTPRASAPRATLAPGARRVFTSLGRISFEKNMHWIATALGMLKQQGRLPMDIRVFIVGPPHHAEAQSLLETSISEYGLENVLKQHSQTDTPEDYYCASDATILFSPSEGLPNVAIESLSAGRPVIISAAANAAEVISDGVTGWIVRTGDIAHLAETIAQVAAKSDEELANMHAKCEARASDFSIDLLVSHYMHLYEEIAHTKTATRVSR
jgi:glycosyltransferase involved in cell wall biosynthesis